MDPVLEKKYTALREYIRPLGSLAVAFSGGVDSTFLLAVAHDVLGDGALAVTTVHDAIPQREVREAKDFCGARNIRHILLSLDPLEIAGMRENGPDRCYHCKKYLFTEIGKKAEELGVSHLAEGSNMDDLGDYRPGSRAVEELRVLSPLRQAQLYKSEIRALSREMGLPTWNKPSYACLATRIPTGDAITKEKLRMIECAEDVLIALGFAHERVRVHGDLARIEVRPEDIPLLTEKETRETVVKAFKDAGFRYVSLDLAGYVTGNMNAPGSK